ncbi:MAG: T9SS type A sorting domain-containing protein, partial [Bacteroidia bacterium]|nr:T9SS type A sorting domain-containing protein [Bacteroidia bacterium]
ALSATVSSGLPITYTSSNTSVATISGSTVTIVGVGTTTITASQPGNVKYNAATSKEQVLTVSPSTGIIGTENTNAGLFVYPNPIWANGMLTIDVKSIDAQTVKIFNMNGQLLYSKNLNGMEALHISASEVFKSGIYNVALTTKNAVINKKIIVK